MASASTPSANEPAKDLILVHTVQFKPVLKAYFSENPSEEVDYDNYYYEKIARNDDF